jgi:hypothetical protein
VSFATSEAQEIKSLADEQKSPQMSKTIAKTPAATPNELITEAAASYKYDVQIWKTRYQNKPAAKDPNFGTWQNMKAWWQASSYSKDGYLRAFLDTIVESLDPIYATAVSYNVKIGEAGTLETTEAIKDAKKVEYRVATFTTQTKTRLEAAGESKGNHRAIIWTVEVPTPEAIADYFKEFLLPNADEHLYASGSQKGFISYMLIREPGQSALFSYEKT